MIGACNRCRDQRQRCGSGIESCSAVSNRSATLATDSGSGGGYVLSAMNRIAELRKQQGWTQEELAIRVGTTKMSISRLENGLTQLTVDWMQKLAKAFKCSAADLLDLAFLADIADDVTAANDTGLSAIMAPLRSKGLRIYEVTGDGVEGVGITPGQVITIDESADAIAGVKTGDIVLARVTSPQQALVLRQFVAPDILLTNRPGNKLAVGLNDKTVSVTIVGVVIRG